MSPGQGSAGSGTHVHWLGGKADRVDADCGKRPRMKRAQPVEC